MRDRHSGPLRLIGLDLSGFRFNDAKLFKGAVISKAQASMLLSELGLSVA
jgi:fluoroquinolone resistance protein